MSKMFLEKRPLVISLVCLMLFITLPAIMVAKTPGNIENNEKVNFLISGEVYDKETDEPIAGAKIKIAGIDKTFYTDLDGNFSIHGQTSGDIKIEATYISYEDYTFTCNLNKDGKGLLIPLERK